MCHITMASSSFGVLRFLETVSVFALNNTEWYVSYLFAAKLMHLHCLPVGGLFFPNGG